MKKFAAFIIGILVVSGLNAQTVLLDYQSTGWKYLDSNINLGTSWVASGYNEANWKTGQAPFGYGVSPAPATTLRFGSNNKKKFITTYFRKTFSITSLTNYSSVLLSLQRDDGAAVYVNGKRAFVTNLPSSFTYTTKASSEISSNRLVTASLADTFFQEGANLITIELHQFSASGPDVFLDCKLEGMPNQAPTANAGADQTITLPNSSVTLTGSGSDPEGGPLTYLWTKISGPATGTIASPTSASSAVTNLSLAGTYVFQLSVSDNKGSITSDQVSITVNEAPASSTLTLIGWGASWKYQDSGSNLGTAWTASAFNDAAWLSGPAQLGYGDGDEATIVKYGLDANAKYITTYFRKTINFSNPAAYAGVTLNVKRDDGIIVYVNGVERYRDNMPVGAVTYTTLASAAAADDGNNIFTALIPISAFTAGANTVAVEIHQNAGTSSDISFDLELIAKDASSLASLSRGPYWQMVSGTAATLRWRTDVATNSRVEIGTQYGTYTQTFSDAASITEHEIRITGLSADTRYYYRFGSSSRFL
ncbi:MAG: PKD domain-containing protein, partial [Chitinophagaceae bacterium]